MLEIKNMKVLENDDLRKLDGGKSCEKMLDVTIIADWFAKLFEVFM